MMNNTNLHPEIMEYFHHKENVSDNGTIFTLGNPHLQNISNVCAFFIVFLTMLAIGCSIDILKIKDHLFKPKGPAIAMLSQFGIMPLAAFCMSKILHLGPSKALVVIICGCCPGGNLSNLFTMAIKGDVNFSIVLTTFSNLAALGMMPLLLFIYCNNYEGLEKAVPYLGIIISLALTLVPCAIGVAIKHFKPKYTSIIKKAGFILLAVISVITLIISALVYKNHMQVFLTADIVAVTVLLPLIGYTLGFTMSKICKLDSKCSRTISMETGCQNTNLIFTIIKVFFPPEKIGSLIFFPLIFMIMQVVVAFALILSFRCYRRLKTQTEDLEKYKNADVESAAVKRQQLPEHPENKEENEEKQNLAE